MTAQQQALVLKQTERFELISNAVQSWRALGDAANAKAHIETRLSLLDTNWAKFQSGHDKVSLSRSSEELGELPYFKSNTYARCEEAYANARAQMLIALEDVAPAASPDNQGHSNMTFTGASNAHRSLPKISLPTYSGDYQEWRPFHDLFTSMIRNNQDLSSVEKFHYLRSSLRGEAAQLISNLSLSAENFTPAWNSLCERYDNKRVLIDKHIDSIFQLSVITRKSAGELKHLLATVKESLGSLQVLGAPVDYWDFIINYIIILKLDRSTHEAWEVYRGSTKEPASFKELEKFLDGRIQALESVEARDAASSPKKTPHANRAQGIKSHLSSVKPAEVSNTFLNNSSIKNCSLCSAGHYVSSCPVYNSKTPEQRHAYIVEKRLCFNCLGSHRMNACKSTKRCLHCGASHHSSIHNASQRFRSSPTSNALETTNASQTKPPTVAPQQATASAASSHHAHSAAPLFQQGPAKVLLATALVRLRTPGGMRTVTRALLDQGSEISFISESLTQHLQLKRQAATLPLIGIGAYQSVSTKGVVTFTLSPHFDSPFECDVTAYVLPKLTTQLPSTSLQVNDWPHLRDIQLADPHFMKAADIEIVIGAELYGYLLEPEIIRGDIYTPVAQRTALGWIISGKVNYTNCYSPQPIQGYQCCIDHDLHEQLQRFFLQEEAPSNIAHKLSREETECETHFVTTHTRDDTGRYVVRLPFKRSPEELGESKNTAYKMLMKMNAKFTCNTEFSKLYYDFLSEYESLGHMTPVDTSTSPHALYLPHHGVLREASSTTKLRVVFNGSSKTSSGLSLNDILHIGQKLQLDLFNVITWWRQFMYVFSADIEKMFRQIRIHQDDWTYQRILWFSPASQEVVKYMLTTVTYGLGPAPYLANRVLQQLSKDEGQQYPLAVNIIRNGTYVDDTFGGADTLEEAQIAAHQLNNLCKAGGFKLQKWHANHVDVLQSVAVDVQTTNSPLRLEDTPTVRALGISWNPEADAFSFSSPFKTASFSSTKRNVLSCIARLFDPLGWLSPVTIRAKIIMQQLWKAKVNWDEVIPDKIADDWITFIDDLQGISQISIPRWIGMSPDQIGVEIHGFSDASKCAMSAVLYLRVLNTCNSVHISILEAKTKVAPLKQMTIPRLELEAALLLSKRAAHIQKVLNLLHAPIHLWTDSSLVLTWVKGDPNRWRDFISNRIWKIQETTPSAFWHHVPGKDNPADCASRGICTQKLFDHPLWWNGPDWLKSSSSSWPNLGINLKSNDDLEERSKVVTHTQREKAPQIWELINAYSNLNHLLRVTATCHRFFERNKNLRSLVQRPLTPAELQSEKLFWTKATQKEYFALELKLLATDKSLPKSNPLCKFVPFLDYTGLLRVGGRLRNALLDSDAKHPLLLPRQSAFTTLIIADAHERTLHGGAQVMLAYLRQMFWILGGRAPIKHYILRCVQCARIRGATAQQLMGQLPTNRVTPARAFLHSGVDYAGPLNIKTWRGRAAKMCKGYIVLFVCLSTSAIHIEVSSDYTIDGFLASYKRFTSRRGICASLTSDCGTNFIGADSELKRLFAKTSQQIGRLSALLANDGTQWKFNPPAAPHFGGKWEAGVKSVKFHLRRIIRDTALTFEELTTLLSQIEAVLNSRPLCPMTDDADDLNALTPGHFLIGCALNTVPEPALIELPTSRLSRWQLTRQMLDQFWDRWSKEYLQRFQARAKWTQSTDPIKPGALVLVADERYPTTKWPLGRITEVHPGPDGLIRVATVKTKTSTLKRPIVKLSPLPL